MYLFSTGDDGCLCIFDIKKLGPAKPEKASKSKVLGQHVGGDEGVKEKSCELRFQDFGLGYADEILVTRQFLDEKQDRISVSLEGGDNSIASIALRYVLDAFILIHFTYLLCLDTKPSISSLNRWLTGYYQ